MTTTEKNRFIAEFMGYSQPHPDYPTATYWHKEGEAPLTILLYNTDWNWLMEVVCKIERLKRPITNDPFLEGKSEDYQFNIEGKHVRVYAHGGFTKEIVDINSSMYETKIEAVYNAVVEFIQWYNQQQTKL